MTDINSLTRQVKIVTLREGIKTKYTLLINLLWHFHAFMWQKISRPHNIIFVKTKKSSLPHYNIHVQKRKENPPALTL